MYAHKDCPDTTFYNVILVFLEVNTVLCPNEIQEMVARLKF